MADNTNRVAGTAYLAVDGQTLPLVGAFEYDPSNVERESAAGMDGVHGYIEKPVAPSIKGTIRDGHGLRVADLNEMTNVTVVCELANGKFVTGSNMWTTARQSAKAEDGTIEVVWEGFQGSVVEA
jgi:hypothetical protein